MITDSPIYAVEMGLLNLQVPAIRLVAPPDDPEDAELDKLIAQFNKAGDDDQDEDENGGDQILQVVG